jgi:hypothetical protein
MQRIFSRLGMISGIRSFMNPGIPHNPSHADIIETRLSLLRLLPIELVDEILHAAEYYTLYSDTLRISELTISEYNLKTTRVVARTPPIWHPGAIVRVVIRTETHDQGWSSYPEDHGTRNGSWTWIDLRVCRREAAHLGHNELELEHDCSTPYRVYTNIHAEKNWQSNETTLDLNSSHSLLEHMRPGDMLILCAEARWASVAAMSSDSVTKPIFPKVSGMEKLCSSCRD